MDNIIEDDSFNPKKIYDSLIKRCKQAQEWVLYCQIDLTELRFNGTFPFRVRILEDYAQCFVVSSSKKEAMKMVSDFLPVIVFIEDENDKDK